MKITWGMPTLIELDDIEANINLCKSLGLDFIELFLRDRDKDC